MPIAVNERAATRTAEHRFFGAMSLIAAVVIVTGFSTTYGPKVVAGTTVPAIIHVHAAVFASWLVLFVAQTMLVMRGRIRLHQQIGSWGMVLAGLMLVVGVMTAVSAARLGHRGLPRVEVAGADGVLLFNLASAAVFTGLAAAASSQGWHRIAASLMR